MKEWHPVEINGGYRETRERDGVSPQCRMDCEDAAMEAETADVTAKDGVENGKEGLLARQVEQWIAGMERLQLSEYVRYVNDRKRMLWSNFWGGVARGVGTAVGFTILGAILVLILQNLAKRNLPLIGDALAQIVSIVQMRLQ